MLRSVRILLVGLNILNWICVAAFALVLVGLLAPLPAVEAEIARSYPDDADLLTRFAVLVLFAGMAAGVAAHVIFRRLVAIVDTVAAGVPFSIVNAVRLLHIAWALLAIQLLDLVFGFAAVATSRATDEYFGWSPSVGGWLAVLLLFVLARVFRRGAEMQDELAATV